MKMGMNYRILPKHHLWLEFRLFALIRVKFPLNSS